MDKPRLNFLDSEPRQIEQVYSPRPRRRFFGRRRILLNLFLIILIVGVAYAGKAVISSNNLVEQFGHGSLFSQLKYLVGAGDTALSGEDRDRINILLLGIGGEEHQGGQPGADDHVSGLHCAYGHSKYKSGKRKIQTMSTKCQ